MKSEKQVKWVTDRVQYIRGLKSPNEQQRLLVILHDKADKTATRVSLRVFVITGSSNFLKIREAGKTSTPSFYSKLFKQSLN